MKYESATFLAALIGLSNAVPVAHTPSLPKRMLRGREVPQEHSHENILSICNTFLPINNPNEIQDCVFGLLGNAAGAAGEGKITNTDCLQQATADQCFSNAKASADVAGMTACLQYRALERNTGKVGLQSVLCNETAVNPEIAAITQHQDPASANAAATNKDIVLKLAVQIDSIGGNAQDALATGTFAPGNVDDSTGAGNSCDDATDANGCINTLNLLQDDASAAEIDAAVGSGGPAGSANAAANATSSVVAATPTATVTAAAAVDTVLVAPTKSAAKGKATPAATPVAASAGASSAGAVSGKNVQTFTGDLGGLPTPVIEDDSQARPFSVGGDTFLNIGAAIQRSCDQQKNACATLANSGKLAGGVGQCETQQKQCVAAGAA